VEWSFTWPSFRFTTCSVFSGVCVSFLQYLKVYWPVLLAHGTVQETNLVTCQSTPLPKVSTEPLCNCKFCYFTFFVFGSNLKTFIVFVCFNDSNMGTIAYVSSIAIMRSFQILPEYLIKKWHLDFECCGEIICCCRHNQPVGCMPTMACGWYISYVFHGQFDYNAVSPLTPNISKEHALGMFTVIMYFDAIFSSH
jgi:hypothetical protein